MATPPSVVIVGGGTMGLAAAWRLAQRNVPVTVLDAHDGPHEHGSHSGFTRVIRQAYHEGSEYVPLVQRADDGWCELERGCNESLLVRSGLVEFGAPGDEGFAASVEACRAHGIEHELSTAEIARDRWPFAVPDGSTANFTSSGGYLRVVPCLDTLRRAAVDLGAEVRSGVRVDRVDPLEPAAILANGERVCADRLVVAAGVGTAALLRDATPPSIVALRRVLLWLGVPPEQQAAFRSLPVWAGFVPDGFFYGFPYGDDGIEGLKVACHTSKTIPGLDDAIDPATLDRSLRLSDLEPVERFLATYFPAAGQRIVGHRVCMYGATPDWNFIVDRHPNAPKTIVAAGFSGHGFKFAPAIGSLVAEMLLDQANARFGFEYR